MDTFQVIKSRRSVRKFLDRKIPDVVLYAILEAGNAAPAAGNHPNWKFIIVEDKETKKAIARAALKQDWIAQAPVIVVACSDPASLVREYGAKARETFAAHNVAAAIQNMLLAAANFGIGSTWIGAFAETPIRKECRIPDNIDIIAVIPFGYAAERPVPPSRPYFADVLFWEYWKQARRGGEEVTQIGERIEKEIIPRVRKELERHLTKAAEEVSKAAKHIKRQTAKGKKK